MRHGRTDWNARRRMQGSTDIPLNDEGRVMAERAAVEYEDVNFDICYCSPLSRARETAEIVLRGRDIPIITDKRLVEMGFGGYEGIDIDLKAKKLPINTLFTHPDEYVPTEGAESMEALFERTGSFIREIIEPLKEQGKDVLIVGHGTMNSSIICQMKDVPLKDFWSSGLENCKLIPLT